MAKQYRPSFTESQLILILEQTAKLDSLEGKKLHSYLSRFSRDIITGWKAPAFTTTGARLTTEQSLGFAPLSQEQEIDSTLIQSNDTETRRSQAVLKYTMNPSICSREELEDVYNYKLIHGFASKEEEEKLEAVVFG